MNRVRSFVARTREAIASSLCSLDWPLVILIAGFALIVPILGGRSGLLQASILRITRVVVPTPNDLYESSIAAAAVKRPDYQHKLETIDRSKATVKVATFRSPRPLPDKARTFDIWVALADQLRTACRGAADPVRRLQQILGLPPVAASNNVVTEIEVAPDDLFRPCVVEGGIAQDVCPLKFPEPPAADSADRLQALQQTLDQNNDADARQKAVKEALDEFKVLRSRYDHLYFVTRQMWTSYRADFSSTTGSGPDYGYPFTGMGWTYDWSRRSRDHVGVSEFIVKREAAIKIVSDTKPADFCQSDGQRISGQ